jgi:hypothetical protein
MDRRRFLMGTGVVILTTALGYVDGQGIILEPRRAGWDTLRPPKKKTEPRPAKRPARPRRRIKR